MKNMFLAVLLLSGISFAQNGLGPLTNDQVYGTCFKFADLAVDSGTTCLTSKKAKMVSVNRPSFGLSWQSPDGLIWSDRSRVKSTYREAEALCASVGARLPTEAEFLRATEVGAHEAFRGDTYTPVNIGYFHSYFIQSKDQNNPVIFERDGIIQKQKRNNELVNIFNVFKAKNHETLSSAKFYFRCVN